MNTEALRKLLPIVMIILTVSQMVRTIRWMILMGTGAVYGLPADIAFVLSVLSTVLLGYVALQQMKNREDAFWLMSPEGALSRNLFLAVIVIDLLIPVFKKAAELV